MKRLLPIIFILSLGFNINAQENDVDVNELFELNVDSIERKITINRWGTDTSYFLHFSVENTSTDTLMYKTNTCFYYNHSSLTVGDLAFDLNAAGGCYLNSHNFYLLAPGGYFTEAQWITAYNLKQLEKGEWYNTLSVPLVQDDSVSYCVDGRDFVENEQYLNFKGKAKVVEIIEDNRRRKKRQSYH